MDLAFYLMMRDEGGENISYHTGFRGHRNKARCIFVAFRGFVASLIPSQSSEAVLGNGWLV
jgi:hypothetical protein